MRFEKLRKWLAVALGAGGLAFFVAQPQSEGAEGQYAGLVGMRGIVKQQIDGASVPVWADYDHATFIPTWQQPAVGNFKDAVVVTRPIYDSNLSAYDALLAAKNGKFTLMTPTEYSAAKFKDRDNHDLSHTPTLLPATTQVAVWNKSEIPPGGSPIAQEFVLNPRVAPATKPDSVVPATDPPRLGAQSDLATFLVCKQDACVGAVLRSSSGNITYLADFMEPLGADEQRRSGICDPSPLITYTDPTTGKQTQVYDDQFRFARCDEWRIKRMLAPVWGARINCGACFELGASGFTTNEQGKFVIPYEYDQPQPISLNGGLPGQYSITPLNYYFLDTLLAMIQFAPDDPRVPFGSRWFKTERMVGGTPLRSVNVPVDVSYMIGTMLFKNEQRDGVGIDTDPSQGYDVNFDDTNDTTSYYYVKPNYTPRHEYQFPIPGLGGSGGAGGNGNAGASSQGGSAGSGGANGGAGAGGKPADPTYSRVLPESDGGPDTTDLTWDAGKGGSSVNGGSGGAAAGGAQSNGGSAGNGLNPPAKEREDEIVDRGLLQTISREDAMLSTDYYVFAPDGTLLAQYSQVKVNATLGIDCTDDDLGNKTCKIKEEYRNKQAGFNLQDFVPNRLPGSKLKVIVINRATGYMGVGYADLSLLATDKLAQLESAVPIADADGHPIKLRPPNLVVKAERTRLDRAGAANATSLIGFEGGALTEDPVIKLTTEWRDWDGSPLPANLPGMTGRITRLVKPNELGPVAASNPKKPGEVTGDPSTDSKDNTGVGHFNIKPGTGTHFVRLASNTDAAPEAYHYYVHVSGQRFETCMGSGCKDFTTSTTAVGPLSYRPQKYVPIKVPIFDEARTEKALETNIKLAKAFQANGTQKNVVSVDPIYTPVYRPEYEFSIFDLKNLDKPQLITKYDPKLGRTVTTLSFGYDLTTWEGLDPLQQFGPDQNPIWSLGYDELLAVANKPCLPNTTCEKPKAEFKDLESLQSMTPAAQLNEVSGAINTLTPSDYLGLELYLDNDRGNPLYSMPQVDPIIVADVGDLVLTRRLLLSSWPNEEKKAAVLDDYRVVPFQLVRKANVSLQVLSPTVKAGTNGVLGTLAAGVDLNPGPYYLVIDTSMTVPNGASPKKLPNDFILSVEATPALTANKTQVLTQKLYYPVTIKEERIGSQNGQIVEHDVDIVDGAVNLQRVDFDMPGLGPHLQLLRSYSSAGRSSGGLLGVGWSHSFSYNLVPLTFGDIPAGTLPKWVKERPNNFLPAAQLEAILFPKEDPQKPTNPNDPTNPLNPTTVLVNGAVFRLTNGTWIPERGRHGKLQVVPRSCRVNEVPTEDADPDAPPPRCYVYTAPDGTRYKYPSPTVKRPQKSTRGTKPTMVEFDDTLYTRVGVGIGDLRIAQPVGKPAAAGNLSDTSSVEVIEDRYGNAMNLEYEKEYLTTVTDATGRICKFDYSPTSGCVGEYEGDKRRLYNVRCQDGFSQGSAPTLVSTQYCYDADGNLEEVSSNGRGEHYGYKKYVSPQNTTETDWNLDTIRTKGGVVTSYEYNDEDKGESGTDTGETQVPVGLDIGGIAKHELVQTAYLPEIQNDDAPIVPAVHFKYKDQERDVTSLYPGATDKVYQLNRTGNPVFVDEALGRHTEMSWSVDGSWGELADGDSVKNDNVLLRRQVKQGDGPPLKTLYQYDAQGHVIREVGPGDRDVTQGWTDFDQLDFGALKFRQDLRGVNETWDYDGKFLKTYTDPRQHKTEFTQDEHKPGLPSRVEVLNADPPFAVQLLYDTHGNPLSTAVEGALYPPHLTTYDARGLLLAETDSRNSAVSYGYQDDLVTYIWYPPLAKTDCSDAQSSVPVRRGYDADGNLKFEIDRNGQRLDYTYTGKGLLRQVTRRLGADETSKLDAARALNYYQSGLVKDETDWEGKAKRYEYNALGFRTKIVNRLGVAMTIVPDLLGNPLSVTDYGGLTTTFSYDAFNRERTRTPQCDDDHCGTIKTNYVESGLSEGEAWEIDVTDEAQNVTYTFYDAAGNLVRRVQPNGDQATFEYDVRDQLIKSTDEDNIVTEFQYDVFGHQSAILRKGEGGGQAPLKIDIVADPNGNVLSETRSRGRAIDEHGQEVAVGAKEVHTAAFDAWNRPYERTFGTYKECLAYDNEGHQIRQLRSVDGTTLDRVWQRDQLGRVFEYDDAEIDEHQGKTLYQDYTLNGLPKTIIDGNGHVTTLDYDFEGRPKSVTEGDGERSITYVRRDGMGNPQEVLDYNQKTWKYDYTSRHLLKQITPPVDQSSATVYSYTPRGELDTVTDGAGNVRDYDYFPNGKLQTVKFPTSASVESSYVFSPAGRPTFETHHGSVTERHYDEYGRADQVYQYGTGESHVLVAQHTLDDVDNVTSTLDASGFKTVFGYDDRNLLTMVASLDAAGQTTAIETREYMDTGELRSIKLPAANDESASTIDLTYDRERRVTSRSVGGEKTSWTYDPVGFRLNETLPKGQPSTPVRTFVPDKLNRLHQVIHAGLTTTYEYDNNDNLLSVSAPGNASTTYAYDDQNRLKSRTEPEPNGAVVTTYSDFDGRGNPRSVATARGETTYTYDHYDRPVTATYPAGDAGTYRALNTTWVYDDDAHQVSITERKKTPAEATIVDSTLETYSRGRGQLLTSQQRSGMIAYGYYPNGDLQTVISPGGKTEYTYDGRHLPRTAVIDDTLSTTFDYYPDGRLKNIQRPGGSTAHDYWPKTRRTKHVQHNFSGGHHDSVDYTYDANGNVTQRVDTQDSTTLTTNFVEYDAADRLKSFNQGGVTTSYTYENFNRKTEVSKSGATTLADRAYTYDNGTQLKTIVDSATQPATTTSFTYDLDGNNTGITVSSAPADEATFAYDSRSQLVRAVRGPPGPQQAVVGLYDYNSAGQRIRHDRSDRGDIEAFVDPSGAIVDEVIPAVSERNRYHRGVGLLAQVGTSGNDFFYQDAQGSVTGLANSSGARSASLSYDPWGNVRSSSGNFSDSPYRYTGQTLDEQTGLYYYGARYYNPKVGRFQTEDSYLGNTATPESLQRYNYVYNNPASHVDPTGHCIEDFCIGEAVVVGAFLTAFTYSNNANAPLEETLRVDGSIGPSPLLNSFDSGQLLVTGAVAYGSYGLASLVGEAIGLSGMAALAFEGAAATFPLKGYEEITTGQSFTLGDYLADAGENAALNTGLGLVFEGITSLRGGLRPRLVSPGASLTPEVALTAEAANGAAQTARVANSIPAVMDLRETVIAAADLRRSTATSARIFAESNGGSVGAMLDPAFDVAGVVPRGHTILSNEVGSSLATAAMEASTDAALVTEAGRPARFLGTADGRLIDAAAPETTITLTFEPGMNQAQFAQKARALQDLGEQGLLHRAVSPVERNPSVTRTYRNRLIKRINALYGEANPEFAERAIHRVRREMQPDHIWELQLGGPDTAANLKMLDTFTNWHIGTRQIRPQLLNVAPGTRIRVSIVGLP